MNRPLLAIFLLLLALLFPLGGWADVAVPPLAARVTDLTGTLSAEQRGELERTLQDFESRKGSQIAVLLVPTTQPETVEQYAIRVAEKWRLGRKGVDDGVLLLVAKDDRALRIEVGYGLEGAIPDAVAKRIISEIVVPRFREQDFFGGIRAGVEQLIKSAEGEPLPAAAPRTESKGGQGGGSFPYILFAVYALSSLLRAIFGLLGAVVAGVIAGVLGGMIFGSALVGLFVGLLAFGLSFAGGRGGVLGSGGGGSSGGGGGGFSGGGGGFGGGGASGRW